MALWKPVITTKDIPIKLLITYVFLKLNINFHFDFGTETKMKDSNKSLQTLRIHIFDKIAFLQETTSN